MSGPPTRVVPMSNEDKMMAQIQQNELILKQLGRVQAEQEFEIQVKSTKLAELRQLNAAKIAELTKSKQILKNLEQTEAAARRNAKHMRALAESQSAMLPQISAQLVQLDQQQSKKRADIVGTHRRTYEQHLAVYSRRADVAAMHRLQQQISAVRADYDAAALRLAKLKASRRQLDANTDRTLGQQIIGMAAHAVRLRDLRRRIGGAVGRHRQLRERLVQRQQLLQCYERRRLELQQRLQQLKKEQTHAFFFDNIESVGPIDLSRGGPLTMAASQSPQPSAAASATDGFDIESELDQLNISGQLPPVPGSPREPRRVHFNPTNSVRPIAAIGCGGGSSSSQASGSDRPYLDMTAIGSVSSAPAVASVAVSDGPEVVDDVETEPLHELNSNDSFMCELAANNADRNVSPTQTTTKAIVDGPNRTVTGVQPAAASGDQFDLNNTIIGDDFGEDGGDLNDVFLGDDFRLFGDRSETGLEANATADDEPVRHQQSTNCAPPPAKRAKLVARTEQTEQTESSQNQSFRSTVACSEFDFEFAGFDELVMDDASATAPSTTNDGGRVASTKRHNVTDVSRTSSLFNFDGDLQFNAEGDCSDLF